MDGKPCTDDAETALVAAARELGYKESTISRLAGQVRLLWRFCEGGVYTKEAGEAFIARAKPDGQPYGSHHTMKRRRVVALVEGYLESGAFDLRPANPRAKRTPSTEAMSAMLEEFRAHCLRRGLRSSTREGYCDMARELMLWLEGEGATGLGAVTPSQVLGFLSHMMARRPNTDAFYIKTSLKPFLAFLGRDDLVACLGFVSSARSRKVFEVLDDGVEDRLAAACREGSLVCARDAAMTLIALTTGLRAGDILDIRLGDVDWSSSVLTVRQNKTGNLVSLPMQPAALAALGRYVLDERPEPHHAGDDHVFLRARAPHGPMTEASTVYQATERALAAVGSHGGGSRLFRRNAATKMLRSGASSPVISAVLGHADPTTTGTYMEMDAPHMRSCVLALPKGATACP